MGDIRFSLTWCTSWVSWVVLTVSTSTYMTLGHVLGLGHEQIRFDADQYVIVVYEHLLEVQTVYDSLEAHPILNPTKTPSVPLTRQDICSDNRFAKRFMPEAQQSNGDTWMTNPILNGMHGNSCLGSMRS
jgi:hypothetical protein